MPIKLSTTDDKHYEQASYIVGLWPDSSNRTTGQSNCKIDKNEFVSVNMLNDRGYATTVYVDNKDSNSVHISNSETITGAKTFTGGLIIKNSNLNCQAPATFTNTLKVNGGAVELKSATHVYVPTPSLSDDRNSAVTLQTFEDKFKIVSSLPSNPDPNTFYFVLA